MDKDEELERLERENKALLLKITELEEESKGLYKVIAEMKDKEILMLERTTQLQLELKEEQSKGIFARLFRKGGKN